MSVPANVTSHQLAVKRELLAAVLRKKARTQTISVPLSYGQKALWFLYRSAPDSAAYHVSFSARIRSALDVAALHRAFQKLINRHGSLRAVFTLRDGEPVQEIGGHWDVCFQVYDCSGCSRAEISQRVAAAYRRPFDLEQRPGFRVDLFTSAPDDHVLLVTVHHIVYDAWSLWLNLEEVRQLYPAEIAGCASTLDLPRFSYRDHIRQQEQMLAGPEGERLWNFWKRELEGDLQTLNLPTDRPRPPVQTLHGRTHRHRLSPQLTQQLKKLAQDQQVTPFALLLAAYQVLLYRYTGQHDILVGTPTAGRGDVRYTDVVGYFVNPVVLRANLAGNPPFDAFLREVMQNALNAFQHQDYPFPLLVERLQPRRDPSHAPLVQVSFVYQKPQRSGSAIDWLGWSENPETRVDWGGLQIEYFDQPQQEGQFDLELEVLEAQNTFGCLFKYNIDLFDARTIERLAQSFEALLTGIAATPVARVDRLPVLSSAEHRKIVVDWNATAVEYPRSAGVHKLFEQQVQATPSAVALIFGESSLTYSDLNKRVNRLARCLAAAGVGPGSVVGVRLERSIDMVVALHAIVKSGAAYLPLDPEYPLDRIEYMAKDADVTLVLTHANLARNCRIANVRALELDTERLRIGACSPENPEVSLEPDDIAYVIYTSGSTGRPKGVAVPHRGLLNRLQWMQAQYQLDERDRVLQKTPYSFDVSVWEFFWPLMTGAALVIAPPGDHRDARRLVELIRTHGVTTLHFVPSMLRAFLEDDQVATCESLRHVVCSGEALPFDLQQKFFATLSAELHNLYGPTEASIDVSHWTCRRHGTETVVPIGHPIANTALYILDAALNPVPIGVAGELHIGGVGLARGYLKKPELTREKFISDPFSPEPGARLYKTGDLARYRPDGAIEYLGRLDHQVKVRGFRIELGEIESVLAQHPDVDTTVVVVREDHGDKRLVAYVVSRQGTSPTDSALREYLGERLPEHMVPLTFVRLETLPLNANGKIDRRALPAPETFKGDSSSHFLPPRDAVEQLLVRHWEAVLKVRPIGVRDDFFARGGHSLLAVNLMARVEKEFAKRLPITTLFRRPTVEQLAELLRTQAASSIKTSPLIPIQPAGAQTPFFCVAGGGGSVLYYYPLAQYLGRHLLEPRPFFGLQAIGLEGECEPLSRVEDLAAAYLQEIRTVQPSGPYVLGGHCFGGLVAFEMSQQLLRQGESVALLAIMDVPARRPPSEQDVPGADDASWFIKLAAVMKESSGTDLGISDATLRQLDTDARLHYFNERMQAAGFMPPGADVAKVRGLLRVFATNSTVHYAPQDPRPVPIVLFRAAEFHPDYDFSGADDVGHTMATSSMGWSAYAQGEVVAVHLVPGNHITMMSEPHAAELARKLALTLASIGMHKPISSVHLSGMHTEVLEDDDPHGLPLSAQPRSEVSQGI
jgi:amino acid adenylation domain-containing protein